MSRKITGIAFLVFIFLISGCHKSREAQTGRNSKNDPGIIRKISADEAVLLTAKKYGFAEGLLKYEGIDAGTGFYMINLTPEEKPEIIDGVQKNMIFVDPLTSRIMNPYQELLNKKLNDE